MSRELFIFLFAGVYCCLIQIYIVHKQWVKAWFLKCQMPVLSGRLNFDTFSITSSFFAPKIPMKYSKNSQNFATSKNTSNVLFETCWTQCKKPHFFMWPRSTYTFLWMTLYYVVSLFLKGKKWYLFCNKNCTKNAPSWDFPPWITLKTLDKSMKNKCFSETKLSGAAREEVWPEEKRVKKTR